MSQGRTHDSDIQALVEMGQGSAGVWSRDDAVWALEQTRGDVGRAGTLLINITSNGGSVDAWRSRNAPPAPGGGSTMPPPRVEDTRSLMMKIKPYAISTAQSGIKELLISTFAGSGVPGGKKIGERLAQVFDIVIKGNDDSGLESKLEKINKRLRMINDRVKVIEVFIGSRDAAPSATRSMGQMKNNKSKKKNKSKRKKRKTKQKSKK